MLKIMEIHPAKNAQSEYIVLQNVGLVTVSLRGWALCTDAYLEGESAHIGAEMYIFREDVPIKPYARVVLFTGRGEASWVPTTDGKKAYCVYWNRAQSVWEGVQNAHVLKIADSQRVTPPASEATQVPRSSAAALDAIIRGAAPSEAELQEGYAVVTAQTSLARSASS